ncbi:MAG: hypothetical protein Q9197_004940 [Variospora fuerteventurae]
MKLRSSKRYQAAPPPSNPRLANREQRAPPPPVYRVRRAVAHDQRQEEDTSEDVLYQRSTMTSLLSYGFGDAVTRSVARNRRYCQPRWILLAIVVASAFTFLFDTVRKLNTNRYASDQTLPNHAAQLYTAHTLLPLLFTRVLETAPFRRMFKAKWEAAYLVDSSVPWDKSLDIRPRTASPICSMTGEQAWQLSPVLHSFQRSLWKLDCYTGTDLSVHLLAEGLPRLTESPIRDLDKAILSTRNRSHPWELAVAANELFHVTDGFAGLESINTHGLEEIIWYTKNLDRRLNDSLPLLEVTIRRILTAHESYLNVTTALDNLGLSRCRTNFEREFANMDQLQDDMMDNGKKEEGKGDLLWRWSARLQGTIMGDALPPRRRMPNISVANALSDGLYAYWALYCLIYTLRWDNNLLHESANSFIPPREFRFLKERPPPLQFPKEQRDTMASLFQADPGWFTIGIRVPFHLGHFTGIISVCSPELNDAH